MDKVSVPSQNEKTPLFSVIILCWNNLRYLQTCLNALVDQTYKDFEIVLIDNGSDEPVLDNLLSNYSQLTIKFQKLDQNIGFAAGNNLGATYAEGDYLVALNADAFPRADWLETIYAAIQRYPDCALASKLIMANDHDRLDGEGDVYHISGLVWRRSYNTLVSRSKVREGEVFSACAAAAVYPRKAFEKVGGFDPDYFAYVEDVDLGFRLRLAGYRCVYIPEAVVYHVGSGSTGRRSDLAVYYGFRNLIWTFYKNMPGFFVFLFSPANIMANALLLLTVFFRSQGKIAFQAQMDAILTLPKIFSKRMKVQSTRKIHAFRILHLLDIGLISPVLNKLKRNE